MDRPFCFNLVINVEAGSSNFLLPPQRREVEEVNLESVKFHVKNHLGDAEIGPVAYITSSVFSNTVDILKKIAEVQYQLKINSSPSCLITSQNELNKIIQECKNENLFLTLIVMSEVQTFNISAPLEKDIVITDKEGRRFLNSSGNTCSVCKIEICGPLYLCISCENLPKFCTQCQSTHDCTHLRILAPQSNKCCLMSQSFSNLVLKNELQRETVHYNTMEQNSDNRRAEERSNDNDTEEIKVGSYGLMSRSESSMKLDSSFTSIDSGEYDFGCVDDDFHVITVPDCFDTNLPSSATSSKYIIVRDSDGEALLKSNIGNPNEECINNQKEAEESLKSQDVSFVRMSDHERSISVDAVPRVSVDAVPRVSVDVVPYVSVDAVPHISVPLESASEMNRGETRMNEITIKVSPSSVQQSEIVFQPCENVSSSSSAEVLSQPSVTTTQVLYKSPAKPNSTSCYTRSFQEISDPFSDCNEELDIAQFFSSAAQKVGKAAEKTAKALKKFFRAFQEDVLDSAFQVSNETASLDWIPVGTRWSQSEPSQEPCDFNGIMAALIEMGFANRALNKVLINTYKCKFEQIMNHISTVGYQHEDYDNSYILI